MYRLTEHSNQVKGPELMEIILISDPNDLVLGRLLKQ